MAAAGRRGGAASSSNHDGRMTKPRAAFLVLVVAMGAYANSLGNGFAYDDTHIVERNPVVTTPMLQEALLGRYWPSAREGSGLYRPVVVTSLALEWQAFGGSPLVFHLDNVIAHALVSLVVMIFLTNFVGTAAALGGALLFAVHPVHVEAVANIVGRSEVYAAAAVLFACHLYLSGDNWEGWRRGARLLAISLLYLLGLGSKEIAVTLPGILVALDVLRPSPLSTPDRLRRGLPVYLSLLAVLAAYLVLRVSVLGTVTGEVPAPALRDLTDGQRILTGLTVWPHYVRLLLFPLDLAADYSPALVLQATGVNLNVLAGAAVLLGLLALAWLTREREPLVSLGVVWFCIAVLPVSNLVIPAGVILAERTLYLPSVGLSIAVAGLVMRFERVGTRKRASALGLAFVLGSLLMVRTVLRNPTWLDTFTVLNTLAMEHPESYLSLQSRGLGLERAGEIEAAREAYEAAVSLVPMDYGLLVQVAEFYGSRGQYARAEDLLRSAIRVTPDQPEAYKLLSEYLIRESRAREGHAVALMGLTRAGPDRDLFALVSESYIAKGDLEAATRARLAALGQDPGSSRDWGRLADLYEAMHRAAEARAARAREAATAAG